MREERQEGREGAAYEGFRLSPARTGDGHLIDHHIWSNPGVRHEWTGQCGEGEHRPECGEGAKGTPTTTACQQ